MPGAALRYKSRSPRRLRFQSANQDFDCRLGEFPSIQVKAPVNVRESHARGLCWKLVASRFCVGTADSSERIEHNLMIRLLPGIPRQLDGELRPVAGGAVAAAENAQDLAFEFGNGFERTTSRHRGLARPGAWDIVAIRGRSRRETLRAVGRKPGDSGWRRLQQSG